MKRQWALVVAAAVVVCLVDLSWGALSARGQDSPSGGQATEKSSSGRWYNPKTWPNPIRWIRKDSRTASEELEANSNLEKKLISQLQRMGLIPARTDLKNTCSIFRSLEDCVGAIHASHNLGLEFNCLKFDVTGADPSSGKSSCAGPAGGKAMSLAAAIRLLKPEADAKTESKNALRQARGDISDAGS